MSNIDWRKVNGNIPKVSRFFPSAFSYFSNKKSFCFSFSENHQLFTGVSKLVEVFQQKLLFRIILFHLIRKNKFFAFYLIRKGKVTILNHLNYTWVNPILIFNIKVEWFPTKNQTFCFLLILTSEHKCSLRQAYIQALAFQASMWAMPSLSYSRTGSTAQIHGNDWGVSPEVWALDHQI